MDDTKYQGVISSARGCKEGMANPPEEKLPIRGIYILAAAARLQIRSAHKQSGVATIYQQLPGDALRAATDGAGDEACEAKTTKQLRFPLEVMNGKRSPCRCCGTSQARGQRRYLVLTSRSV